MVILDPYGMTFDAVGVFGLAFHLLFKSLSTYCGQDLFFLKVLQYGFKDLFTNRRNNQIAPILMKWTKKPHIFPKTKFL